MKKILVTGKNSYVGTAFANWMSRWNDRYIVTRIDLKTDGWKDMDFSQYDVVFHVAGIAHVDTKNVDESAKERYYDVNCNLTIEVAKKSKEDGVKQFIFMSSIIVFGECSSIRHKKIITRATSPSPTSFYGDSKLQAEKGIYPLDSEEFRVVILRSPMIYGKNSKGNYPRLSKIARKIVAFPNISNQRSMLYIDNLCEFIRLMIDNEERGFFYPQNDEYASTPELVKLIANAHGKNVMLISIFNPIIRILPFDVIKKVFGTFVYDQELSKYKSNYIVHSYKESISITEH